MIKIKDRIVPIVAGDFCLGKYMHRLEILHCPYCNKQPHKDRRIAEHIWFDPEYIKYICPDHPLNKGSSIIVVSECKMCFQISWIHVYGNFLLDLFEDKGYEKLHKNLSSYLKSV